MAPRSRAVVDDSDVEPKAASPTMEREAIHLSDKYVIIEDGVYDMSKFQEIHPGGDVVMLFTGQDVTAHFYMLHQYESVPKVLEKYRVGTVVPDDSYVFHSAFTKELRSRVRAILPPNKWWAPPSWWAKAIFIMCVAVFCDFLWIWSGPSYAQAIIGGLAYAAIGLNIQHDANHGAVSKNGMMNRLWGYTQDYIGGSRMLWIRQHVVGHHVHCNREGWDPDIKGNFVMNLSQHQYPSKVHMRVQNYYYMPLLHLLGFNWVFGGLYDLLTLTYKGEKLPESYARERNIALALRIFFYIRRLIVPLYLYPSWHTVWCTYLFLGTGAAYLGFFFILSHIFEEAKAIPAQASKVDWTVHQIESSSNLCGWKLAITNGGLNYQIEHHLFPRMSHAHYSLIAPVVREVCEKHNIAYVQFNSIFANVLSCARQLKLMGSTKVAELKKARKQKQK